MDPEPLLKEAMYFTKSHEWVIIEGDIATVGISDYAKKELGELVYIELPLVGEELKALQQAAILESTKAASDVYAPISGKVIKVNQAIKQDPASFRLLSQEEGWLFKLKISKKSEVKTLLTSDEYMEVIPKG